MVRARQPKYGFYERNQTEHQSAVAGWLANPGTDRRERLQRLCREGKEFIEEQLAPLEWFIDPAPHGAIRNALADEFESMAPTDAGILEVIGDLRDGQQVSQVMFAVFLAGVFGWAWCMPWGTFDPAKFLTSAANEQLAALSEATGLDSSGMKATATDWKARIERIKDHLRQMAASLREGGWPIDPVHEPNLLVLGELSFLKVDWSLPAGELANMLSTTGLVGFSMDLRGMEASDHASAALERDATAYRRAQRSESGHPHIDQPYAGGQTRRSGERGLAGHLRAVWPEFRRAFPDARWSMAFNTWDHSEHRPGGWLRKATNEPKPTKERLRRLFKELDNSDGV